MRRELKALRRDMIDTSAIFGVTVILLTLPSCIRHPARKQGRLNFRGLRHACAKRTNFIRLSCIGSFSIWHVVKA